VLLALPPFYLCLTPPSTICSDGLLLLRRRITKGATATTAISGATLGLLLSGFMVVIAPAVAFKAEITTFLKQRNTVSGVGANASAGGDGASSGASAATAGSKTFADVLSRPASEIVTLLGLGGGVGYMSGLFGVGGGALMYVHFTPCLVALRDGGGLGLGLCARWWRVRVRVICAMVEIRRYRDLASCLLLQARQRSKPGHLPGG
jgi:hypothetical protein